MYEQITQNFDHGAGQSSLLRVAQQWELSTHKKGTDNSKCKRILKNSNSVILPNKELL